MAGRCCQSCVVFGTSYNVCRSELVNHALFGDCVYSHFFDRMIRSRWGTRGCGATSFQVLWQFYQLRIIFQRRRYWQWQRFSGPPSVSNRHWRTLGRLKMSLSWATLSSKMVSKPAERPNHLKPNDAFSDTTITCYAKSIRIFKGALTY